METVTVPVGGHIYLLLTGVSYFISPFYSVLTGYVTVLLAIHHVFLSLFCFPPIDYGVWIVELMVPALSKCTYVRNPNSFHREKLVTGYRSLRVTL